MSGAIKKFSSANLQAKTAGENLVSWAADNEVVFKSFCQELVKVLQECFKSVSIGRCRSSSAKRARLWTAFNEASIRELPMLCKDLYSKMGIEKLEPLFHQTVNLLVFEGFLKDYFKPSVSKEHGSMDNATEGLQFSKDELNILRYACGYVVLKVLKRYKQQLQSKARKKENETGEVQCEVCLNHMIGCGEDDAVTQYTSEWFDRTNRGGLFSVNSATFTFFLAVETVTRKHLPQCSIQNHKNTKDLIVKAIAENCDVQFFWTLISQEIDGEEDAIKLLEDIATMWVTIRGFSLASAWLEEYKRNKGVTVSKTKALRKKLQREETAKEIHENAETKR